jgi:hypothetical protein
MLMKPRLKNKLGIFMFFVNYMRLILHIRERQVLEEHQKQCYVLTLPLLFSHSVPSTYTPTYETPNTWDCITVVSDFPDVVPAHPLDILPHIAPEPVTLRSLMRRWPYTTHRFTDFHPQHTDGDPSELWLAPRGHFTHAHTLEHSTFCQEHVCPTHFPYGGNRLAK